MGKVFTKSIFTQKVTKMTYRSTTVHNSVVPFPKNYQLNDSQTYIFLRVLQILRICGRAPISAKYYVSSNRNCVNYESFKFFPLIIYTALLQIILAFGSLFYLSENGALFIHRFVPARLTPLSTGHRSTHVHQMESSNSPLVRTIMASMDLLAHSLSLIEHLNSWQVVAKLAQLLNNWNGALWDINFRHSHSKGHMDLFRSLQCYRNSAVAFAGALSVAIFTISFLTELHGMNVIESQKNTNFVIILLRSCFQMSPQILFTMEDVKLLLLFKISENGFQHALLMAKDIALGMKRHSEKLTNNKLKITEMTKFIMKVRSQCQLLGNYITVQMMLFIASALYYMTGALYVVTKEILSYFSNDRFDTEALFPLMFAIWQLVRYFIIINDASRISEREQALVAFLSDWEQECWEEEGEDKRQIQRLYDRLVQNPTEISLGGYVTLNRKLILGILNQTLTQIIIFLQFDNH